MTAKEGLAVLLALIGVGGVALADPILSGSSSFQCDTQVLSETPIQFTPVTHPSPLPESCEDYSGTWTGGCYGAVMKCPRVTELGDCIPPGPDEVYLDNLWVRDADVSVPPTTDTYSIQIEQQGCRVISVQGPEKTLFEGKLAFDMSQNSQGDGALQFTRACQIDSEGSWRRTFAMSLHTDIKRHWDAEGGVAHFQSDARGRDTNYGATYRNIGKWRLYHPGGDKTLLRVDFGYWTDHRNYDPAVFEGFPPDFGGQICVWRKETRK